MDLCTIVCCSCLTDTRGHGAVHRRTSWEANDHRPGEVDIVEYQRVPSDDGCVSRDPAYDALMGILGAADGWASAEIIRVTVGLVGELRAQGENLSDARQTIRETVRICDTTISEMARRHEETLRGTVAEMVRSRDEMLRELTRAHEEVVGRYEGSLSWRATKPLRWVRSRLYGG